MTNADINWGPSGLAVYERTYSRPNPDGTNETWRDTAERTARGNLELVHGPMAEWPAEVYAEYRALVEHIFHFQILPAGRHLWASGVKGRQFLMNCWTSGWTDTLSDHFEFTFMRLMEGGGVGGNYSSIYLQRYGLPKRALQVHIVCDPSHPDYDRMLEEGVLSTEYTADWEGSFLVEDSREGWAAALVDLIDTFMHDGEVKHVNRVYDVTNVRCEGSRLKTFGGTASGPRPFGIMLLKVAGVLNEAAFNAVPRRVALGVPEGAFAFPAALSRLVTFPDGSKVETLPAATSLTSLQAMLIDHYIAECVVSGGVRRSARMAIVHWKDPQIEEFISCKANTDDHYTTNISVEIDDEFLEQLTWDFESEQIRLGSGEVVRTVENLNQAQRVHRAVVTAMLENGEPGYWNSSLSNHGELTPVYATNPCGEIALNEHEPCVLAHVNLDAFAPEASGQYMNEGGLIRAHELTARFAVRATFGDVIDEKSREIITKNRRIGVGHLGVQGFIVKHGYRYSDVATNVRSSGYHWFRDLLVRLGTAVDNSADRIAFELRIPAPIKTKAIAPTGSISKLPGASESIQTIYARYFEQRIRYSKVDPRQMAMVEADRAAGFEVEVDSYDASGNTLVVVYPTKHRLVSEVEALGYDGSIVESADEISVDQALAFQAMYQSHYLGARGNAVSYTVNVPEGLDMVETADTIQKWLPSLKGTTIMVDGTRPQAPYTRITEEQYELANSAMLGDGIDENCATGACPIR